MNEYYKVLLIFLLITFFHSRNSIYSQEKIDSIYQSYYKEVGLENTALFYGKEYLDKEATINDNNKFLKKSNDFSNGDIIYRNHLFKNIFLKYNVVDDIVFVKIKTGKDISSIFQLISKNIDCFKVESKKFKRLEKDSGEGFYEEIFKNDKLFLFKKYQKKEFRRLDKNYVYYEYYSDKPLFFLRTKGILHSFNSKKEVISLYPDKKKEIRRFYKQYKQLLKDNPDSFAKNLLNSLL